MHTSATSSIKLSSCAGEKERHVDANDRKTSQQLKSAIRGQRLSTTATAESKPVHVSNVIMPEPVPNQNRLGARINASAGFGNVRWSWANSSSSCAIPLGAISA